MPKETLTTRVTTLEAAMIKLTNTVNHLAEIQAKYETQAHERETRTDERIGKLVSAIGELISQMKAGKNGA